MQWVMTKQHNEFLGSESQDHGPLRVLPPFLGQCSALSSPDNTVAYLWLPRPWVFVERLLAKPTLPFCTSDVVLI